MANLERRAMGSLWAGCHQGRPDTTFGHAPATDPGECGRWEANDHDRPTERHWPIGIGQPTPTIGQGNDIGQTTIAIGRPTVGIGQPNAVMGQRNGIGQTTVGIGQPTTGIGQPNAGIGQRNDIGQTTIGIGKPMESFKDGAASDRKKRE